jgi:glycosyltransferase involved in cell wall biosynthesis
MNGIRVSVIIPARNAATVLPEALDSVIAQTYPDWEAIVADDASSDGTHDVAAAYHPRVSVVRSERNLGIGGARNLAIARARGELLVLLDADDLLLPTYLESQVARYDEASAGGRDVGIVCCDAHELGPGGLRENTYSQRCGWVSHVTLTTLLRHNTVFVSALVPRATVEQLGGFATDCLGAEDYDLWLRIVEAGRDVIAVREPLVIYRVAGPSVSTNVAGMARATQTVYRHALARGRLDARQRRIARRELRLQRFVELWEESARSIRDARRGQRRMPWRLVLRSGSLGARVVLERPRRWAHWLGIAVQIARGAPVAGVDRSRLS